MGNVRAPEQSYVDTDVEPGKLYVYRVLAVNAALPDELGLPSSRTLLKYGSVEVATLKQGSGHYRWCDGF